MITKSEIRPGAYFDSVVLMHLQRALAGLPGVDDAGVVMATPANKELLKEFELLTDEGKYASPDDLLIVVRAKNEEDALSALEQVDDLIKARRSNLTSAFNPKSLEAATKQLPEADWVLISVPGRFAAGVAEQAINLGKHVFLYSDNVSIEDEIKLKKKAQDSGLLVMGPDCGTAILNGVGLGFANRVRRGPIGIIAASGTGLQAVTVGIHNLGSGISQAIGTGGRDLKTEVGAITALQSLELLSRDEQTQVIVLVSKPPSPDVATKILGAAQAMNKPVVVQFIGYPPPAKQIGNLYFSESLLGAAELAVRLASENILISENQEPVRGYLRGLFSGGTLAYEAMLGLQTVLSPLFSNVPIQPDQKLIDAHKSKAHCIVDLGEDEFTQGRLHPMMDNDLRLRRMQQEIEDPETGTILFDMVLGEGSHPDPASEFAPIIESAKKLRPEIPFIAIVVGTDEDPQDIEKQISKLEGAGAQVFSSVTEAVSLIANLQTNTLPKFSNPVTLLSFQKDLAAINVGLESFFDSLKGQEAEVVQVDWRPPAGGNEKLMEILNKMKSS